jgi:hypothetical protein
VRHAEWSALFPDIQYNLTNLHLKNRCILWFFPNIVGSNRCSIVHTYSSGFISLPSKVVGMVCYTKWVLTLPRWYP